MRILIALFIPTALLGLGCSSSEKRSSKFPPGVMITSPAGRVIEFHDAGSRARGVDVGGLLDEAVAHAEIHLAKYGIGRDKVARALPIIRLHGIDDCAFQTISSETGWATGQYDERYRFLAVSLYSVRRIAADAPFPPEAVPWTCRRRQPPFPAEAFYGVLDKPFPALGHELGHHFFGGRFEHGWTPPLVEK